MVEKVQIGVIGGSGLYNMPEITDKSSYNIDTPFGKPSADVVIGTLRGKRVAFIPRHGVGHIYTPSTVPYRANLYALKTLGVRFVIAVNACGSLREDYAPGDIVIPDQLYDYTRADRGRTFFDTGMVAHIGVADPLTPQLSDHLYEAVRSVTPNVHRGGTFLIIEGPRYSTRGESHIYRQWGCSLIGMTTCPEAFLAAEAEMAYTTMAHVTDYDVWHEEPVNSEIVASTFARNIELAQQGIARAVETLDDMAQYECHHALSKAFLTARDAVSPDLIEKLKPIVGRYFER
jgi:5'-methylthioadenosine phosphorylase